MKFNTIIPLFALGYVAAECEKILVTTVETCLKRVQIDIDHCNPSDQSCLCKTKLPAIQCYSVCSKDAAMIGQRQIKESEVAAACNAAGINTSVPVPTAISTTASLSSTAATETKKPRSVPVSAHNPEESHSVTLLPSLALVVFLCDFTHRFL